MGSGSIAGLDFESIQRVRQSRRLPNQRGETVWVEPKYVQPEYAEQGRRFTPWAAYYHVEGVQAHPSSMVIPTNLTGLNKPALPDGFGFYMPKSIFDNNALSDMQMNVCVSAALSFSQGFAHVVGLGAGSGKTRIFWAIYSLLRESKL